MMYNFNSIWDDTINSNPKFKKLNENISVDVCVIGGGITGVSIAYYLYKNNINFALLERDKICNNTTKFSTAKITSQHDLVYTDIIKKYGVKYANQYLEANNEAIRNIENIITRESIECDFKKQDSYVFTQDMKYSKNIIEEYKNLVKIGFKDVEVLNRVDIPLSTKYAIKFKNQAKFNPKKYTLGLANIIKDNIFENSKVIRIEKNKEKYTLHTEKNTIECNKVIITTHFPIKDIPGFHFIKMYQDTSYVVAADIGKENIDGMYISYEEPTISLRTLNLQDKNILFVGGNNVKTGDVIDEDKYTQLENLAKKMYPNCKIINRWNTQDCITLDKIPYIGKFSNFYPNVYIATGFNKWGMTSSNIAANIVVDKILNKKNKYEDVFNSTRLHPIKNIKPLYYNISQTIQSMFINKLKIKKEEIEDIPNNTGKIIKVNNINVGVYKDEKGKIYKINPYCSHLNCLLTFNIQDKTWDCPCHGSRFNIHGNLINGPANEDI